MAQPPPDAVIGHHIRQKSFAQAAIGHPHARRWPAPAYGFQDRASRQHQIGTIRSDARVCRASRKIPREELRLHGADLRIGEPDPIDLAPIVFLEAEMHTGQRRHRAGRADQVEAGIRIVGQFAHIRAFKGSQHAFHFPDHRIEYGRVTSRPPWRSDSVTTPTGRRSSA